jgi:Flp pilus assembly pilin Flp
MKWDQTSSSPLVYQLSKDQKGQTTVEYILLLSVLVSAWVLMIKGLGRLNLQEKLSKPLKDSYAKVYKYGHPKAKGIDEGSPERHPAFRDGSGKNRLFINPR